MPRCSHRIVEAAGSEFAARVGADSNWNISTFPQCAPDLANGLAAAPEYAAARIFVLLTDYLLSQGSKLWLSLPAVALSQDVGNKKGQPGLGSDGSTSASC